MMHHENFPPEYVKPGSENPEAPVRMDVMTAMDEPGKKSLGGDYNEILRRHTPGPRVIEEEADRPDHTTYTAEHVDHDANDNMAVVAKEKTEATTGMSLTMMVLIGVVVLAAMYFLTRKSGSAPPPPSGGGGGGGQVQGSIGPQGASMQGGGQFSR